VAHLKLRRGARGLDPRALDRRGDAVVRARDLLDERLNVRAAGERREAVDGRMCVGPGLLVRLRELADDRREPDLRLMEAGHP
jgi:hypothetical protein